MIKGLKLSRLYYEELGRPMLHREFADYEERIAAGLVGQGSECFGFDDEISTDHDYGPSFCLWLNAEDYGAIGSKLQMAYESLPKEYMGVSGRQESANGGGRVGVNRIDAFYGAFVGRYQPPADSMDWFKLPEHNLAAATNGEIFRDDLGEFSRIRSALLSYYPEDVRRKKLASKAVLIAQSGQYNYSRCVRRGETGAEFLCLGEFIRNVILIIFLLNRQYAPFYKWMYRGLESLPILSQLKKQLTELALLPNATLIEEICAGIIGELRNQCLSFSNSDFLQDHAEEIMSGIADERIRRMHIMEG